MSDTEPMQQIVAHQVEAGSPTVIRAPSGSRVVGVLAHQQIGAWPKKVDVLVAIPAHHPNGARPDRMAWRVVVHEGSRPQVSAYAEVHVERVWVSSGSGNDSRQDTVTEVTYLPEEYAA